MERRVSRLPQRLAAVASEIEPGSRVADIGTDHGKLPLWLAATGRAAFCLATETEPALLARSATKAHGAAWAGRLAFRTGDGLAAIEEGDHIDTVVIAGVGGRTIVRLLTAPRSADLRRLVLQPRSEAVLLRRWLSEHGWRVASERLTEERGRFHLTLAAGRGDDADLYRHPSLDREDLLAAGPLLVRSGAPEVARAWRRERDRLAAIGSRASRVAAARARFGLARAERVLAAISKPA